MNIRRKDFLEALKLVAPATKRGHLPITHCVKLSDATGALRVEATDLDLTIQAEVGSNGILPATIVPHAPLQAFVHNAGDDLDIEVADNDLRVASTGSALTLRTLPAEDFPNVKVADGQPINIGAEQAATIGRCLYAASKDGARPILTGLGIIDGWAVCTDSYRLSAVKLDTELPSAIIPAHVVEQVLKNTDMGFGLAVGDIRTSFLTPGIAVWTTRLIEGQFPNWQRLVGGTTGRLRCERADILGALDRVDVFNDNNTPVVRLSPSDGGITFSVRSADAGEVTATIPGELSEALAFTPKYLVDLVKATDGDIFDAGVGGPSKPCIVGSLEAGRVQLLMPVRA